MSGQSRSQEMSPVLWLENCPCLEGWSVGSGSLMLVGSFSFTVEMFIHQSCYLFLDPKVAAGSGQ